ncbi:MAG: hypothetical protein IKD74_04600 [Clostridia bacterium]|jgi:hypothetical protein|nr:hypothetical protein [Clostridia bacterium]
MEEKQLVIRNKDIFSKIRVLLITLFRKQENLKNTQKRDVKILKKQYENGQITLGDLTEQELKEYNELIEAEMQEKAQKELYVYNLLMTAK